MKKTAMRTDVRTSAQETINSRVKKIRKILDMSQMSFSRVLSLSSGYLAGIETERRKVNDRLIKLLCSSFNVNKDWLRSGKGKMFLDSGDEAFTKLAGLFKELSPEYRQYIFKQIELLLQMQDKAKQV
jgi:transcriptional regulator with XRE-family HTH domain